MSEENKAVVRRIMQDLWQNGDKTVIGKYYSPDYVDHNALPGLPPGLDGLRAFVDILDGAFTNGVVNVESQVAEGDMVVTRWFATNTHSGEFMGVPATGKQVSVKGLDMVRIKDGQVVEAWGMADMMGLMQQIGAVPAPA